MCNAKCEVILSLDKTLLESQKTLHSCFHRLCSVPMISKLTWHEKCFHFYRVDLITDLILSLSVYRQFSVGLLAGVKQPHCGLLYSMYLNVCHYQGFIFINVQPIIKMIKRCTLCCLLYCKSPWIKTTIKQHM